MGEPTGASVPWLLLSERAIRALGGPDSAVAALLGLMTVVDVFAADEDADVVAGALVAANIAGDIRAMETAAGAAARKSRVAGRRPDGVTFADAMRGLDAYAQLRCIDEYLYSCQDAAAAPTLDEYLRAFPPGAADAGVASVASREVAGRVGRKSDARYVVPIADIGLRIAIDKRDPAAWGVREELEPGTWFHVELSFDSAGEWRLAAYLSSDPDGRIVTADCGKRFGGKVCGIYEFSESQRTVTVEIVPQVGTTEPGA